MNIFPWIPRVDNAGSQTGIWLGEDGVAAAQIRAALGDSKPRLEHCCYEAGEATKSLGNAVRGLPMRKLPTVSVLPSSAYQLLHVEAPDVPGDELRAAIRWRIKDLINFHIDDAVIDVFQMPAQGRGGVNQMMYAVAAKADYVRGQVETLENAGLKLEVIDVAELALRNIAAHLEQDGGGVALLHLANDHGILLLVKQGVLYLTRRIETGMRLLREADGLRSELVAGLALEARRSLDYFESHYEQTPITVLYTTGLTPADQDLMTAELSVSVRNLSLSTILDTELELDDELQRLCLPAIGAALRKDTVKL